MVEKNHIKIVVRNRKAKFNYHIMESFEAGLVLLGSEVKSIRLGRISISEAYIDLENGELFLVGCHIAEYPFATIANHDPVRKRKLLLHKREIKRIASKISLAGFTAIPLSVYFKNGKVKVEIALAKGRKKVDKRHEIQKKDQKREAERELKKRYKLKL